MAVIHISEAEAARDLRGVLARVRAGEEVHIAEGDTTIAIVQAPPLDTPRKTLSGAIQWADEQDLQILLDDRFGDDLEQVICNHEHESLGTRWED
jgi:antitoxin (DNA-binding transcriptional repressor) of toxin-antitoxin stability system